jgi:very-short-patch-repair endonuclease
MDWRDWARRQSGVISRDQLRDAGIGHARIDGLVARRELLELLPGVYSPRPVPGSSRQRMWAAALWSGGVISHRSAASLWQLPVPRSTVVHVTVADGRFRRAVAGVQTHRVPLARLHRISYDGLPVTDRARTLVDLLRTERLGAARGLLDRALQQDWLGEYDVEAAYRGEPGRTGNGQLRRLLAELEPGAQAESERRMHRLLRSAGITGWTPQYQVRLPRSIALLDIAFPEQKLAIEVDGRRYHDDRSDRFETDRERQNDLVALGWRVIRVTWTMLTQRPHAVLAQIAQLLAA